MRHLTCLISSLMIIVALAITGCTSGTETPPGRPAPTVTVTGAHGPVTVPVTDHGIWALDYQTAITLLALGVVPTHAGRYSYEPDPYVKASYTLLQQAGVELVEPGNAERIAAASPALIIGGLRTGSDEIIPQLTEIAPTVLLPNLPVLANNLQTLAMITGHQEQAELITARLDISTAKLRRRIEATPYAGASVSVLSACGPDLFCSYGNARRFGPILTELGLKRPSVQSSAGNEWGYQTLSPERLDDHGASIMIEFVGSVARGGSSPLTNPILDTTGSVTGRVDFTAWFGVGPFNAIWVLHDLEAILLGEGRIAGEADAPTLWAELTAPDGG